VCYWSESLSLVHPSALQSLSRSLSLSLSTHTHTAEFYRPKVPNLKFEYWCQEGSKEFCKDPAFIHGTNTEGGKDVYNAQTCSTEQQLIDPACDPARLNQEGKEVDCWTDPKGGEEVKFHTTAGHRYAWLAIAFWVPATCFFCWMGYDLHFKRDRF